MYLLVFLACYLLGAVPFGYLIARMKGVDLFQVGSGNIGATNVGRTLGRKFGILVFVLDFLKGALPVAGSVPLAQLFSGAEALTADQYRVGAGACAFFGHLFPIFLRFRGGKGVATGAGVVAVLAPIPFLVALLTWLLTVLISRMVSLASIVSMVVLTGMQFAVARPPWNVVTGFCVLAMIAVTARHTGNIARILKGTENTIRDGPMRQYSLRVLHLVAIAMWVGGAAFFNFVVATTLNATFPQVVETAPNDRTAFVPIVPPDTPESVRKDLASALFGAAVGPIFPKYFILQITCAVVVLATAWSWRTSEPLKLNRVRFQLAIVAFVSVLAGMWISEVVTRLRLARFDFDPDIAGIARQHFATWHLVSLALSLVTIAFAFAILVLAAWMPTKEAVPAKPDPS